MILALICLQMTWSTFERHSHSTIAWHSLCWICKTSAFREAIPLWNCYQNCDASYQSCSANWQSATLLCNCYQTSDWDRLFCLGMTLNCIHTEWWVMTLNCIHIFIVTGSFLYWCVVRPASQRFFVHSCIYLRILIISYLATFLGTNSLSVLMCRKAINQSIN